MSTPNYCACSGVQFHLVNAVTSRQGVGLAVLAAAAGCMRADPNQLWVADVNSVPTWSGLADVAFVIDVFLPRRIVGVAGVLLAALRSRARPGGLVSDERWPAGRWRGASLRPRRICPSVTRNSSPNKASSPRSDPWVTPTTTRWPRPSRACSRASRSTTNARFRGARSRTSSSRPSAGALVRQQAAARAIGGIPPAVLVALWLNERTHARLDHRTRPTTDSSR